MVIGMRTHKALAVLAALAVALGAAFVRAPSTLAANGSEGDFSARHNLVDALRAAFIEYWRSGHRGFPPDLERVVDYWSRYHVAKAVFAAALLIVFVALGVLLWRAFLKSGGPGAGGRRVALASAAICVSVLALVSVAAVMANVQGAMDPFSSVVSMLPLGAPDGQLTGAVDQIRQGLAHYPDTSGQNAAALQAMVDDFGRYHAVLAVMASIVAVVLIGLSVTSWRGFAATGASSSSASGSGTSDRRTRRTLGSFGVLSALLALAMTVIVVANTATAADPAPALLDFFKGGW